MTISEPLDRPNYFRGQERIDLVEDLAQGGLTHAQLADKYGRHIQTIHQFSARNHAEIARRKRELHGELNAATVNQWVSDKAQLGDLYWKHYQDLEVRLSDPDLDDRTLKSLTREAVAIADKYADLMGWKPTRTQVEVHDSTPVYRYEVSRTVKPEVPGSGPVPAASTPPQPVPAPAPRPEPAPVQPPSREPTKPAPSSPSSPRGLEDVPEEERRSFLRFMS